jgi:molybdate transport system substrate-binding protein
MPLAQTSMPITGISSMATRAVLAELAALYEARTERGVSIESVGGVDAAKRVQAGEPFDVVILARSAVDDLSREGHLVPSTAVDLVHSGVAVAVRAGAPRLDISSEERLRRAVQSARGIGISTGPSGVQVTKLFDRWGLADDLRDRLVVARPGVPVGTLVARGEVELGFQQLSELIHIEGLVVLGPLPAPIQIVTTFAGAVAVRARQPEAARDLLAFMASPTSAAAKRRQGMEAP